MVQREVTRGGAVAAAVPVAGVDRFPDECRDRIAALSPHQETPPARAVGGDANVVQLHQPPASRAQLAPDGWRERRRDARHVDQWDSPVRVARDGVGGTEETEGSQRYRCEAWAGDRPVAAMTLWLESVDEGIGDDAFLGLV